MDDGQGRNRFAVVMFGIIVVGAVLAVFPATAPFGALLCFLALVPAGVAR